MSCCVLGHEEYYYQSACVHFDSELFECNVVVMFIVLNSHVVVLYNISYINVTVIKIILLSCRFWWYLRQHVIYDEWVQLDTEVIAQSYFDGVLVLWHGAMYSVSKYSLMFIMLRNVLHWLTDVNFNIKNNSYHFLRIYIWILIYCRMMLCKFSLCRHAVSVCLSRSYIMSKRVIVSPKMLQLGSQTTLVFPYQTSW